MGISLLKKILCRKDFVELFDSKIQSEDKLTINSYFEKIRAEKGKIISIENIESRRSEFDDGTYTDKPGIYTYTINSYLIHYKCHKQIS
ncbi:MAG TPA: hypothetical protein PK357_02310 [Candidatus Pacearchaeota archaeon]|nr:hypothetical protein [Candidatus Pacearchaeota archaeon]